MIFYIGVLPHSIRLALLVTFFRLRTQNVEYSKRGCQFQYCGTLSGAFYVLTVENKVEFNKYLKLKHQRFMSKLSNVHSVRYLVTTFCIDEASPPWDLGRENCCRFPHVFPPEQQSGRLNPILFHVAIQHANMQEFP